MHFCKIKFFALFFASCQDLRTADLKFNFSTLELIDQSADIQSVLALKMLIKTTAGDILIFVFFRENKT